MKQIRRKLVQQGSSTMMVSLPAPWIKSNNLTKGSEISIETVDEGLLISAKKQDVKKETIIVLRGIKESEIRTMITNTYRLGYDKIKVEFADQNQYKVLDKVVKTRLIGFEIVTKDKSFCIVENVTEPAVDQFDNIMHKIFFSITEIFELTRKRLENYSDDTDYEDVEERIQKYDNFCRRVITKQKLFNEKSDFLWNFLTFILHGQRELYHLNKMLSKDIKISTQTLTILSKSEELFNLIGKGFFNKDISILKEVHEMEKDLIYSQGYQMLEQKKGREIIVLFHILNSIRQFYQANSPLSGIIL